MPYELSTLDLQIQKRIVSAETIWENVVILDSNDNTAILGQHLIEAHWKYFTIEVKDQYECDDAAHLHYEFLIQRCQPKHYLPVLSIFRPSEDATELDTHIHPKPNIPQPGEKEEITGEVSCFFYQNSVGHIIMRILRAWTADLAYLFTLDTKLINYRTRAIITRSWLETVLEY